MKTKGMKTRRLGALLILFSVLVPATAQTNRIARNWHTTGTPNKKRVS
jgi:hypothetical protein